MLGASWHAAQFVLASALVTALVIGAIVTAVRSAYLRGLSRRDLLLLAGCLALALALRLAAKTFVASTSLESAQALGFMSAHRWGPGLSAILSFLSLFAHLDVATIARFNVVISLATIAALFVLVDTYFEDRFAAFAAAAVLALQPIAARYANSDSSAVLQALCLVAGAAFLARWGRRGGRWLLLQGVGWLAFAANVRYESVIYTVAGLLVVVGVGGWPRRGATRELLLGGVVGALFLVYPVGRALLDASGGGFEGSPFGYLGVFPLSPHSPTAVVVVAFVGVLAATLGRFRAAVSLLVALVVISVPSNYCVTCCCEFPHRFSQPQLAFWAAFAGYGCSAVRRLLLRVGHRVRGAAGAPETETPRGIPPLAAAVVLVLAAAAVIPHRAYLRQMWTYALEYEFVVAQLRALPDECLIVAPIADWEARGLRFSAHLSVEAGRKHRWARIDDAAVLDGKRAPCTVYYRAATCHAYEALLEPQRPDWTGPERPECRRIGELFDLEPIATTTLPARSYTCEAYTVDPVPAGFYRLRPRATGPGEGGRR